MFRVELHLIEDESGVLNTHVEKFDNPKDALSTFLTIQQALEYPTPVLKVAATETQLESLRQSFGNPAHCTIFTVDEKTFPTEGTYQL